MKGRRENSRAPAFISEAHPHLSEAVGSGARGALRLVLYLRLESLRFLLGIRQSDAVWPSDKTTGQELRSLVCNPQSGECHGDHTQSLLVPNIPFNTS